MRLITLLVALTAIVSPAAFATDKAPDWTLISSTGKSVHLAEEVKQQATVLLFWATWCPYCKALMPHLQSVSLEYGERIRILAVHFRDDDGDPVGFVRDAGYDFTLLTDGDDVARLNDIWGTPGLLIVDTKRNIRFDLYELPKPAFPEDVASSSHGRKAGFRAPYWAAEIRRSLDGVLAETARD